MTKSQNLNYNLNLFDLIYITTCNLLFESCNIILCFAT